MHAQIVQDHPGACPICGMDLVEAKTGEAHGAEGEIHIDTATQQKMGVRLAPAARETLNLDVRTHGTVRFDESGIYKVTPTVDGVVSKLHAQWPGQRFASGQVLYEIYSQELLMQQYEYVDYLKRRKQTLASIAQTREQNRRALEGAHDENMRAQVEQGIRQSNEQTALMQQTVERDGVRIANRLRYGGMTPDMLARLAETGSAFESIPVRAKRPCLVREVHVRSGATVGAMTELVTCAGSDAAWIDIAIYPDQQPLVRDGDRVRVAGLAHEPMEARLALPETELDVVSRVLRGRVVVPNPGPGLKPGAVVEVTIHARPHEALAVPRAALIRTGHGDFVMLARGDGHFLPTPVEVGIETDDLAEITDGLQEGAEVVVNGTFLMDSASSLATTMERMGRSSPSR